MREYRDTLDGCLKCLFQSARQRSVIRKGKGRCEAGVFDLIIDDMYQLYSKQNGLCYYSKIPMSLKSCSDWQMSLDRINDNIGYTKENSVLCCLEMNHRTKWTHKK